MNIICALYLFCSGLFLLALAAFGWRHRSAPASREFAWLSAGIAFLVIFYAMEFTQERLEMFKLILRLEWSSCAYIPAMWLIFSAVWCGYGHLVPRKARIALFTFATFSWALLQTNDLHGLIYSREWVDTSGAFPIYKVQNGPWYWVHFVYAYTCMLIACILFVRQLKNVRPLHRRQAAVMVLASVVPWLTDIGFTMGLGNGIYLTAFGLSFSAMMFAWGTFRQHLLDMAPVARYTLVEKMLDPVFVFDEGGHVVDFNRAARGLLCATEEHLTEITREDILRLLPELTLALERGEADKIDTLHYEDRYFSLSLTTLRPAAGRTLVICMLHDITELSRAEENLRQLNATLEKRVADEVILSQAKDQALARQARIAAMGEMVAAISHQWRQPLAILSMIVQDFYVAAHHEGTPSPVEWDEFKADAMDQIRHMSKTIDEFRNFQRPDQRRRRFSMVTCLEETLRLASAQFKEHHIILELCIPSGSAPSCVGASSQLTQALLNLMANAKEAIVDSRTCNNGQPEQGRVAVTLADMEDFLLISVVDNGSGIPEELCDRIFEPYFTTKEKQGGSGLGLYLAKMLVETGFGGTLSYSALPEGACFIIELPMTVEDSP